MDTLAGGPDSVQARRDAPEFEPDADYPDAFYRNKWWIYDPERPLYSAIGIHGQFVTIDGATDLVVARFSSLPDADEPSDEYAHMALVRAFADALSG